MNLGLENSIVVITGGTGGIGSQIVADFLEEKAKVVCLIRNELKMQELIEKLKKQNIPTENLYYSHCDLLNYVDIQKTIKTIVLDHKRIDVLVNCAGSAIEIPFALLEKNQIDVMLDTNLTSPIYLCQAVLKPMFKQNKGSIINITSVSAVKKGRGVVVYAAAKAGLESFSRALSQEVGKKNIRVNCVRPGVIQTNMSEALLFRSTEKVKTNTALERFGLANEISKSVLFIASNETASYMTGECITVDGGLY